jgi:hypothetical protein
MLFIPGCGLKTLLIAEKSSQQLKSVSDADLCYAQRHWGSQRMQREINRRRLDCKTMTRAHRQQKPAAAEITKANEPRPGTSAKGGQLEGAEAAQEQHGIDLDSQAVESDLGSRTTGKAQGDARDHEGRTGSVTSDISTEGPGVNLDMEMTIPATGTQEVQ